MIGPMVIPSDQAKLNAFPQECPAREESGRCEGPFLGRHANRPSLPDLILSRPFDAGRSIKSRDRRDEDVRLR
jgi:hypothetical protein